MGPRLGTSGGLAGDYTLAQATAGGGWKDALGGGETWLGLVGAGSALPSYFFVLFFLYSLFIFSPLYSILLY